MATAVTLSIETTTTESGATNYAYTRGCYRYDLERCKIAPNEWLVWVTDSRRRPPYHRTLTRKTSREMLKVKHYAAFLALMDTDTATAH